MEDDEEKKGRAAHGKTKGRRAGKAEGGGA
jgi:hypothetical protein